MIDYYIEHFQRLRMDFSPAVRMRRRMLVHTRGDYPGELILRRHPSEDESIYRWRLENYVCITKPIMNRALDTLHRIFQGNAYSYDISDSTRAYLQGKRFGNTSFEQFIQHHCLRAMIEDANAWLVVLPKPLEAVFKVDLELLLVVSDDQWYRDEEVIIFRTGGLHPVYHLAAQIYIITKNQVAILSLDDNLKYYLSDLYDHNLGELPYIILGGNLNQDGYYSSYFDAFVEFGDEALRQFSDWQSIMANCAYPIKELRSMPCEACFGGYTTDGKKCSSCKGTGFSVHHSPFSMIIRSDLPEALGQSHDYPMLRFHSPDTKIIAYSQQAWEVLLRKALESIHLSFVLEAQSGLAKSIDREELYSMLSRISSNLYDNILFRALWFIERFRELERSEVPVVYKPINFYIKTEHDLLEEVGRYQSLGGYSHLRREAYRQLVRKKHHQDLAQQRIADILLLFDPLLGYAAEELKILLEQNIIDVQAWRRHILAPHLLTQLVQERGNKWFLAQPNAVLLELLDARLLTD